MKAGLQGAVDPRRFPTFFFFGEIEAQRREVMSSSGSVSLLKEYRQHGATLPFPGSSLPGYTSS